MAFNKYMVSKKRKTKETPRKESKITSTPSNFEFLMSPSWNKHENYGSLPWLPDTIFLLFPIALSLQRRNNKQSGFNWHQLLYQLSIPTRQSTPKLSNLQLWPFFYLRIFWISWVVFISRLIFTTLSHVSGAADIFVKVKWSCMTSHFWCLIWS